MPERTIAQRTSGATAMETAGTTRDTVLAPRITGPTAMMSGGTGDTTPVTGTFIDLTMRVIAVLSVNPGAELLGKNDHPRKRRRRLQRDRGWGRCAMTTVSATRTSTSLRMSATTAIRVQCPGSSRRPSSGAWLKPHPAAPRLAALKDGWNGATKSKAMTDN